ncbi:DUF721 domain-containing protein [Streptomyces olivaceiscleroticus]|uniref:DUF721 domain-containing protein n=1 Tax=Streptomyces olivaceiscleroticus TaxID=68245 RepID=A0ABN1BLR5_9ACTN
MSDTPEPSGKDLARLALARYKATAKTAPATKATGRRNSRKRVRAQYGDGRDPIGLGAVLDQLKTDEEWKTGVAAGSLTDQWPELCPELVGKVAPERFDPATGRLDLRPASPAFATQLRLLGQQLVGRLQSKGAPVRSIRVLSPGRIQTAAATSAVLEERPAEPGPVKTREVASAGYRAALAAHQAHAVTDHGDPQMLAAIAAAAARPPLLREPEPADVTELGATQKAKAADTHARALAEARKQKASRAPALPTAFQRTA